MNILTYERKKDHVQAPRFCSSRDRNLRNKDALSENANLVSSMLQTKWTRSSFSQGRRTAHQPTRFGPSQLPRPLLPYVLAVRLRADKADLHTTREGSMAPRVLVSRALPEQGAKVLREAAENGLVELIEWKEDCSADRRWMLAQLKEGGVSALIVMLGDKVDEELIDAAGPSLRVVSTMSAGYDHIDTKALAKRGITLGTTPDALTDATADIGAMLVLMASRRAGEGIRAVVDGKWPSMPWSPLLLCGHALQRSTVGVLGFGKIGQLTLKRLLGFGIGRALYSTSKPGATLSPSKDYFGIVAKSDIDFRAATSLDELAQESDFLVICCALTPETTGIVGDEFLRKMKKHAYVVNTARGPVVDSDALAKAIDEGRIAGAGLDVVTGEPNITADHPLVKQQKVVLLPHIGSATLETRNLMALQSVQNGFSGLGMSGYSSVNRVKV